MIKKILIGVFCLFLLGCVFTVAQIRLNPAVDFKNNMINYRQGAILINATDARENTIVGVRGREGMSAPIEVKGDLASTIKENFALMAKHYGYNLAVNQTGAMRSINARLLVLSHEFIDEPLKFKSYYRVSIAIEVTAHNGKKEFIHIYRFTQDQIVMLMDTEQQLQERLNNALSVLLSQIANDNNLWNFLAK